DHHHVRLRAVIVARPWPDTDPGSAMLDGLVHAEVLRLALLAGDDHVDEISRAQALIGHAEQRIGVRRQIHTHDFRLLVHHVIDEAGVLMAEAVVILPPYV